MNCYRIHLKGTMRKRSPQVQQHALSGPQTNQFHNPYRLANSTLENKPHKTTRSFNPLNSTRPSISSYTYSQNPILPYCHSLTSSYPHPNPSNPHHQDTISVGSTLPCNHPPTVHNTTTRKRSQMQKSNRTQMINSLFYSKK